jgi:hypothetical protein
MQRLASLCLLCGVLLLSLGLVMAVSAMPVPIKPGGEADTCLYCHTDVHIGVVAPAALYTFPLDVSTLSGVPITPGETLMCGDCHTQAESGGVMLDNVRAMDTTQARVTRLQVDLVTIQATHPHWNTDTYAWQKSPRQRDAERVAALIAAVERDGSWGFHDPGYTDQLLTEAEQIIARLMAAGE